MVYNRLHEVHDAVFLSSVKIFVFLNIHLLTSVGSCALCYGTCGGQGTTCGSQFSLSPVWVPGIELGLSGLSSRSPYLLIISPIV